MRFKKFLVGAAASIGCAAPVNAAVSLAWVQIPIDPAAFTTGNATTNGRLPGGAWTSFELRLTTTAGDKFGGGALRAVLPLGFGFYRHTQLDADEGQVPEEFPFNRLLAGNATNPARGLSSGVSSPGNPTTTVILGGLRADGVQSPVAEVVIPDGLDGTDGTDGTMNPVWANGVPPTAGDGTFAIARLTANVELNLDPQNMPIIGIASRSNVLLGTGGTGTPVPIPQLFAIVPEPTMGFALAGLGLMAMRCRT